MKALDFLLSDLPGVSEAIPSLALRSLATRAALAEAAMSNGVLALLLMPGGGVARAYGE